MVYNEQLHAALESVLKRLDPEEAKVIRQLFFDGLSAAQIGEEKAVLRKKQRALRKCQKPTMTKELRQFLDEATPSVIHGLRPTETAVIIREDLIRNME